MTSALHLNSSVHGYHVYNETWTAVFGEILCTERELHNVVDQYAVAVTKDSGETVPRKTSKIIQYVHQARRWHNLCSYEFIEQGGDINCIVTGSRRYSNFIFIVLTCYSGIYHWETEISQCVNSILNSTCETTQYFLLYYFMGICKKGGPVSFPIIHQLKRK